MTSSIISTFLVLTFLLFQGSNAAIFTIRNNCPYTVWAGAMPGGGRRLDQGQSWNLTAPTGTIGRIWPRTNCNFDLSGRGRCQTGDCNGLLQCRNFGTPPYTSAEYSLNLFGVPDFFYISLVNGFNLPIEFRNNSGGCTQGTRCTANIKGQCPAPLQVPGGCNNPCPIFRTNQYCCYSGSCGPTTYSNYFESQCPDARSYPRDQSSTFTCPSGTNYRVVFCP